MHSTTVNRVKGIRKVLKKWTGTAAAEEPSGKLRGEDEATGGHNPPHWLTMRRRKVVEGGINDKTFKIKNTF